MNSAENPHFRIWKPELRRPDRTYDRHFIGDRCPAKRDNWMVLNAREFLDNIRFRRSIGEAKRAVRGLIQHSGTGTTSLADYSPGTTFVPSSVPAGTILRIAVEVDVYSTTRMPITEVDVPYIRPPLAPETYDDRSIRKNDFGFVTVLPGDNSNTVVRIMGDEKTVMLGRPRVEFVKRPIPVGPWIHTLFIFPTTSIHYDTRKMVGGLALARSIYYMGTIQDDIFSRCLKIEVLIIGKGIKKTASEDVKQPSRRLAEAKT